MSERVLIVEDEKLLRWSLGERLARDGYETDHADTGESCLRKLMEEPFDLVLLDYRLPDTDGIGVLKRIASEYPDLPVILMSAYSTVDSAVQAMKLGAFDYVSKPFDLEEMVFLARKALETTRLRREVRNLRSQLREKYGIAGIVCRSRSMLDICAMIRKVARGGATTILLQGESGTGKGLVAGAIHYESDRAQKPFMTITAAALPESLLESELFGHERGAFTDAKTAKHGLLELAHGGTAFLDEIGDLSPGIQAKLLRFMEDKRFKRVGGTRDMEVDVRIIAATNRDLEAAVKAGEFRADLYYRLNILPIHLPPLRERREDIPLLADTFLVRFNQEFRKQIQGITPEAMSRLAAHDWPGNVRELRNIIERAALLSTDRVLDLADLPAELRGGAGEPLSGGFALPVEGIDLDALERSLVEQALRACGGNRTRAARLLGLHRDQMRYRIKKYGLEGKGSA
jgi:DNA-binding NtrC family response regulator